MTRHCGRYGRRSRAPGYRTGRTGGPQDPSVKFYWWAGQRRVLRAVEACGERTLPAGVGSGRRRGEVEIMDNPLLPSKVKRTPPSPWGLNLLKEGGGRRVCFRWLHWCAVGGRYAVGEADSRHSAGCHGSVIPTAGGRMLCVIVAPMPSARRNSCFSLHILAVTTLSGFCGWSGLGSPAEYRLGGGQGRHAAPRGL